MRDVMSALFASGDTTTTSNDMMASERALDALTVTYNAAAGLSVFAPFPPRMFKPKEVRTAVYRGPDGELLLAVIGEHTSKKGTGSTYTFSERTVALPEGSVEPNCKVSLSWAPSGLKIKLIANHDHDTATATGSATSASATSGRGTSSDSSISSGIASGTTPLQ